MDDFVESLDVNSFDEGTAGPQGPMNRGFDPRADSLSSNLIQPHNLDGVVVPSFLYQGRTGGPNAAVMATSTSLQGSGVGPLPQPSFSMGQQVLPRLDSSFLPPTQQLQQDSDAALFNMLLNATSRPGLEGWMSSGLHSVQSLHAESIIQQQQQQQQMQQTHDHLLPGTSHQTSSSFDHNGELQQARLADFLDEQQRVNNQFLLQNRFSVAGEPGMSGFNAANNPTFGSFGLLSPSTAAMRAGGFGIFATGAAANNLSTFNPGSMGLSSSFAMDSSLTSTHGLASLNDFSFLQNQQQQQVQLQLQQERNNNNFAGTTNNDQIVGDNSAATFPYQNPL